jgi:hypothetical protein
MWVQIIPVECISAGCILLHCLYDCWAHDPATHAIGSALDGLLANSVIIVLAITCTRLRRLENEVRNMKHQIITTIHFKTIHALLRMKKSIVTQ